MALDGHVKGHAKDAALQQYSKFLAEIEPGSSFIEWRTDPLVVLQIFSGPRHCGHWSGLIIDRTRERAAAIYFDSLPSYNPKMFSYCKGMLLKAGILDETCNWITARLPKQAGGSNDCGVFMCCTAVAYIKTLMSNGALGSDGESSTQESLPSEVEFQLPDGLSAQEWGKRARLHMIETLEGKQFEFGRFEDEVGVGCISVSRRHR